VANLVQSELMGTLRPGILRLNSRDLDERRGHVGHLVEAGAISSKILKDLYTRRLLPKKISSDL